MGILSKTIDTVKDVGKGVIDTVLDPFGNTRGTAAAQQLVDEGQGYLNTLRDNIRVNTEFWSDHQKMLGDYTQYEWKEALLSREEEQEKTRLEGTDKVLPSDYRKKLIDSGAAAELYALYEKKMNKAKDFKLSGGLEYDDTNIKANILKHSRGSKKVIDRAARQLFNSYGWDKDLFAALGFGRDRTLVSQKMGTEGSTMGNYDFLLQAEDGPIKQKFINRLSAELDLLNSDNRFKKADVTELTTLFENMTIDYKPVVKDAMTESDLLKNPNANTTVNAFFNIESGNLDTSLFPVEDEDTNFVFEGEGLVPYTDRKFTNAEMAEQLYSQRNNNLKEEGGNAFLEFIADHKQITSLLMNVGRKKEFGINVTATDIDLGMAAYNLIKDKILLKKKSIMSGSNLTTEYAEYKKLNVEEKLSLINTIKDTLIEAGGNKVAIEETLPLIKERMKEAWQVTNKSIIKALEASINEQTFNNQKEVSQYKNNIATMYRLDTDNTSYINSLIDDTFQEQIAAPLEKQMQNTFDPLSASLNPTSNLNQDIYTQGVSENIKDEMLKETPVQEKGDTLLEGFLKADFSNVPNFSMKNPKHKAAFNAGEIVFMLPTLVGNDILTVNQYLDASEDVKKAGSFLKRKATSLLAQTKDTLIGSPKGMAASSELSDEEQANFYGKPFTVEENGMEVSQNVLTRAINVAPSNNPEYNINSINFLMAVAKVESNYGTNKNTYNNPNPNSSAFGTMQIIASQAMKEVQRMFLPDTKIGANIRSYNKKIIDKYGSDFDLSKMTIEDMRKPQHSAFMARAYFLSVDAPIPSDKKEWGLYWLNNYKKPEEKNRTLETDKRDIDNFNRKNNIN